MHEAQHGGMLAKESIRLEYSGFMIFVAKMVSVITGLIFQFVVARALTPVSAGTDKTAYDLWFNVNDIIAYFTLVGGVLPFWTMRFVARGREGAVKTGIVANLAISLAAALFFVPLVPTITAGLAINESYLPVYFLISIQIIELYSILALEACLQASNPQIIGYGLLVQQAIKVVLGYILIVELKQLLLGAVVVTIAAFAIQVVYYLKVLAHELTRKIRWEYVREWFKGSLLNIYSAIGGQIAAYIFIMLFAFGSKGGRGRLGAAATVVNVITYSSFLAFALYPKLLAEKKREDITTSLKMVLMFAIPMTLGAVALSDSYVTILTPEYADSALILIVLAIDAFVTAVSGLFGSVLFGVETVDEGAKMSMRQLVKSRLFVAFSLPYLHSAISLPTAFFVLTNYTQNQPFQAALYVAVINAVARFTMFLIQYSIVRRMIKIDIPWRILSKYTLAAAVMGTMLIVVPHTPDIPITLVETAIGGMVYMAFLMAVDRQARKLPGAAIKEMKSMLHWG